eukprot:CAMPEP_0194140950 /NCGR_PEP_ID=MMETSP0152-20130528/10454_1 /TAXON_ID=1049557 /ORGANISM="Thalassiothrix antarctica, Strain L6-D1" /LENGTH=96 /DNA_ID=CAMNT_0038839419 /DNA_START=908 /DNA_END=1198 /DNA_ORIENTATION=+
MTREELNMVSIFDEDSSGYAMLVMDPTLEHAHITFFTTTDNSIDKDTLKSTILQRIIPDYYQITAINHHPRGYNRVVSFEQDLSDTRLPSWVSSSL